MIQTISFTPQMVKAIIDLKKTQTRRPIEPQPVHLEGTWWWPSEDPEYKWASPAPSCPYGEPGDKVKVKDSELVLEILALRAERLLDISDEDVILEGLCLDDAGYFPGGWESPINAFEQLWQSIYRDDPVKGWDANPSVWVIDFRRIQA